MVLTDRSLLTVCLLLAAACSSAEPAPPAPTISASVEEIGDRVLAKAALRTDVNGIRLCVHELEADPDAVEPAALGTSALGREVARELMVTLSSRVNVIDSELAAGPSLARDGLDQVVEHHGVSHVLVGEYDIRGSTLVLTVKLVDVKTLLIVAAVRRNLPADLFEPFMFDAAEDPLAQVAVAHSDPEAAPDIQPLELVGEPVETLNLPPEQRPSQYDLQAWQQGRVQNPQGMPGEGPAAQWRRALKKKP